MHHKGIRIVTLVENTEGVHKGLRSEHGLSFYIELYGKRLLFDTGQSDAFFENAKKLKIDLKQIDALCLSHGHYDHSGGVRTLLKEGIRPTVWIGKGYFHEKFAKDGTAYEYVGNDFDDEFLQAQGVHFQEVDSAVKEVLPGAYTVTQFERSFPDETINPRFWVFRNGRLEPDTFEDEITLVLDTPRGLVVLLGCSHPGVKNILSSIAKRFSKPIYAVLGGTHLVDASDPSMDRSLQFLAEGVAELVGVSHCTGEKASKQIADRIRGSFPNHTGSMLWIE
ncbi:MAG: MBL fold metallo-hydrolase [Spirochaetes bacterium]|nr:MBL fold metallo-hydrolase [Spirochaetota bacterium]